MLRATSFFPCSGSTASFNSKRSIQIGEVSPLLHQVSSHLKSIRLRMINKNQLIMTNSFDCCWHSWLRRGEFEAILHTTLLRAMNFYLSSGSTAAFNSNRSQIKDDQFLSIIFITKWCTIVLLKLTASIAFAAILDTTLLCAIFTTRSPSWWWQQPVNNRWVNLLSPLASLPQLPGRIGGGSIHSSLYGHGSRARSRHHRRGRHHRPPPPAPTPHLLWWSAHPGAAGWAGHWNKALHFCAWLFQFYCFLLCSHCGILFWFIVGYCESSSQYCVIKCTILSGIENNIVQ